MKKNNKFITKKDNKEKTITFTIAIILAILSLSSSYFIMSLFDKNETLENNHHPSIVADENVSIVDNTQVGVQNIEEAEEEIHNLIKSYIYASVKRENEILYALSTNEWKTTLMKKLNETEIQENETLNFVSTSLTLNKNNLSTSEGFFDVSYIIDNNNENIQQNIKVEVVKENNVWKISKIH